MSMVHSQNDPFLHWDVWWEAHPQFVSLASGAIAGMTAEAVLFPLDCLKTRVQSQAGLRGSGGMRGIYRGVGTAIAGSAPASAIFFMTYDFTNTCLWKCGEGDWSTSGLRHCICISIASIVGEVAACTVRVPVDLAKQRLQAGHAETFMAAVSGVRATPRSIFYASFRATAMRDIAHSSLQYPLYEFLKVVMASRTGCRSVENLPTWQAAVCGSAAGSLSAVVTTPLDLVKTRLNLRKSPGDLQPPNALVLEEIRRIHATKGVPGFFCGASFRAAWMGLGGFIFLGSFEFAKTHFTGKRQLSDKPEPSLEIPNLSPQQQNLGDEAPAVVSFVAGLVAGVCVDVPLHPVDTIKTRCQAREGLLLNGGLQGLWNGLSAVLLTSVPGSAIFFLVYQRVRHALDRQVFIGTNVGHPIWRDAGAAAVADVSACIVRVPCEVLKQRMQTNHSSLWSTVRSVGTEGVRGFFAGFGATVSREVPFALIQMPLFEELKRRWHPQLESAPGDTKLHGFIGMTTGCVAGAIAGALTTPFDATKTRIMLTEKRAHRLGTFSTMRAIHAEKGVQGLFSGLLPRTFHCSVGGALWLGAFEAANVFLGNMAT